jgi:sodium-dependent phosphate cotransporter
MHIGDSDFDMDDPAYEMDATWGEVCKACCVKTPAEWGLTFLGVIGICFFLYFFLLGLDLLGNGAKVMGGCAAGEIFGDDMNPVAGLMVGIVATVLLQSSSTTTSIVVTLVGAGTVSVNQGIYMIMGANIGTSVTNTIVAMGHLGDGDQLERAFAGATVHDMFNFLSVACLLPVEAITGMLYHITKACVAGFETKEGEKWTGPVKKLVGPLTKKIIQANKKVASKIALGESTCNDFYPMEGGKLDCSEATAETPWKCKAGLIACSSKKEPFYCPAFFDMNATEAIDRTSGVCAFVVGLILLFICLFALVKILQKLMMGASTRVLYKATNMNGYFAIVLGMLITMLVQSSSITTSVLTPLVGVGALRLEQMLPLTLGANIGTTLTALLAALLSDANALQVALAHLFFNIIGILIWYPIPFMRQVPLSAARALGKGTRLWRGFPIIYILVVFLALPLMFLGISLLFSDGSTGLTVLGSVIVTVILAGLLWTFFVCKYRGGKEGCEECLTQRQKRSKAVQELPDDMEWLKAKVRELSEHTGMPLDDPEAEAGKEEEATAAEPAKEDVEA